ncbi:MAG: 3-isopropylmalate dehydratase large subunit [Gemmatimonas sp.]
MTIAHKPVSIPEAHPHVAIFDTTLRDGEQAPGCAMQPNQKREVARRLARLGVDVIEAGFPASSKGDWSAVHTICEDARSWSVPPVICALARASANDIEAAAGALRPAPRQRLHTFLATSAVHLQHKLRLSERDALVRVREMVTLACSLIAEVEFSAEDASRSDVGFLHEVLHVAIEAGATIINIPDTVGYATPREYESLISGIHRNVVQGRAVTISTHCHDDLGLAVANSLAGVRAGARQVECTVNGLGERAGNAALEEVVMALHTRADIYGVKTRINLAEIGLTSRAVCRASGVRVPPNKAIVGANAFAHEAGIHQDGVLKRRDTYEIMNAEQLGLVGARLVLGKHSGRHALRRHLAALGLSLTDAELDAVFIRFKAVADRKKLVDDLDLAALVAAERVRTPRTLFEKLWDAHVVRAAGDGLPAVLYVDLHLVHEVTSPQAFSSLAERGLRVRRPDLTLATMDHSTPTHVDQRGSLPVISVDASTQLDTLSANCATHGIELYAMGDDRRGIVHVIGPESGRTQPGQTIVCGDSHTSTHGAFGALAFGIGTSEVAHVLATQCLFQHKPRTMEVRVEGSLQTGVTAKDVILALIARIGVAGATGHVIEYTGSTIRSLDMDSRMTICNMSIEAGARAGMIAPDDTTFAYLLGREHSAQGEAWHEGVAQWRLLHSDADAAYDRTVVLDAESIAPMITWGTTPDMAMAIDGTIPGHDTDTPSVKSRSHNYMQFTPGDRILGTPVDVVFIGSCTNGRLSDLRAAAGIMRGKTIPATTRVLVVPGSQAIKRQAEREGLAEVFLAAGAEWRESGCSMCIAMNGDVVQPGQLAVSTSNRNFEGRQGAGARTLLASPLTAAACAVAGVVTDPRGVLHS